MTRRRRSSLVIGTIALLAGLSLPGIVVAAPAISSVSIAVYSCPASIQTPADLANAGGAAAVCSIAGRPGDFGTLEPGFTWDIDPVEYALQATISTSDGSTQSDPEPVAGGFCDGSTMTCHAYQAYAWFNLAAGTMTVTEDAPPPGTQFGWAEVLFDGKAGRGTSNAGTSSVTFRAHPHIQNVLVLLINIVP